MSDDLPARFADEAALEDFLTAPVPALVADLARAPGDIIVLGVAGKMGPTLARLAKRAVPERRVVGVARFSEPGVGAVLERAGVETLQADLLDADAVERLPKLANVVFMAGRKFGASGDEPLTWAMNVHVPAMVARAFAASRVFRTSRSGASSTGPASRRLPATSSTAPLSRGCRARRTSSSWPA